LKDKKAGGKKVGAAIPSFRAAWKKGIVVHGQGWGRAGQPRKKEKGERAMLSFPNDQ